MTATTGSLLRLALLAAAGSLAAFPNASLAGPFATPDCLTPPASIAADSRPDVLMPSVSRGPVVLSQARSSAAPAKAVSLMAQTNPAPTKAVSLVAGTNPAPTKASRLMAQASPAPTKASRLVAQASPAPAAAAEGLPACTYDPPVMPTPQTIRGLW